VPSQPDDRRDDRSFMPGTVKTDFYVRQYYDQNSFVVQSACHLLRIKIIVTGVKRSDLETDRSPLPKSESSLRNSRSGAEHCSLRSTSLLEKQLVAQITKQISTFYGV
jgi:hypothetical protein